MKKEKLVMRDFHGPAGLDWRVTVMLPSHSSAMLVFQHPDGTSSRGDRYAWINAHGSTASDPRERLSAAQVLQALPDAEVARLFRRSMPISKAL